MVPDVLLYGCTDRDHHDYWCPLDHPIDGYPLDSTGTYVSGGSWGGCQPEPACPRAEPVNEMLLCAHTKQRFPLCWVAIGFKSLALPCFRPVHPGNMDRHTGGCSTVVPEPGVMLALSTENDYVSFNQSRPCGGNRKERQVGNK